MQVPNRWWNKFEGRDLKLRHREPKKENRQHQLAALAMCENIDSNVGRILKRLDELDLTENTIVAFFCDNGPNGWRWNGGMKGRKGSTDEGGVRSPLFVRWPKSIAAGSTVKGYGGAIDLLPTFAELAGVRRVGDKLLDGISLAPALLGKADLPTDRFLFSAWRGRVSVRQGPYRLDHKGALFDLSLDPGQRRDVSSQHAGVADRLRTAVRKFRDEVLSEIDSHKRPFLVGHPDAARTQLPARDATASGEIKRSNRFPNCSYFTNWTSTDDAIVCDAEVLTAGSYRVEVYYTCPVGDEGATVALEFAGSRCEGRVKTPHDPPALGAEHDRVQRVESYVKDFKPLDLGVVRLSKGRGPLRLRALRNDRGQVMEFRSLMLTRVETLPR